MTSITNSTNSIRVEHSKLKDTDPAVPVVSIATQDSDVDAAGVDQTAPGECYWADEAAFSEYLDSLDPDEAIRQLAARIRARGVGKIPPTPAPTPADRAAAIAYFKERPPWTAEESEEYERGWLAYEEELKAGELADAYEDELRDAELADAYYKEQ